MPPEWETLYQEALEERDSGKVSEACDRARGAINDRFLELAARGITAEPERERLTEALRALVIHEHKFRSRN